MPNPPYKRSNSLIQADIKSAVEKLDKIDCTKLWLQKTKNTYNLLDLEKTGSATRETVKVLIRRFQKYAGLPESEVQTLEKHINDWWDDVFKGQTSITFEQFYKTRYVIQTTPELQETNQEYVKGGFGKCFDFINTSHDGIISKQEWRVFFKVLGVHDADKADITFNVVDLNKDGLMSRDEFVTACDVYLNRMEPSDYDCFFGPFDEV